MLGHASDSPLNTPSTGTDQRSDGRRLLRVRSHGDLDDDDDIRLVSSPESPSPSPFSKSISHPTVSISPPSDSDDTSKLISPTTSAASSPRHSPSSPHEDSHDIFHDSPDTLSRIGGVVRQARSGLVTPRGTRDMESLNDPMDLTGQALMDDGNDEILGDSRLTSAGV